MMTAQREWFEKDYYKVLGVADTATAKEITKAYRQLARDSHPDTHPGDTAAEERFKEVSAAYDVLGDDAKRKEYDEVRRHGPSAFGGSGGFQPGDGNFNFNVGGGEGLGDLLGQMFGRSRRGQGVGPQRGADIETVLTMSFVEAAQGLTTSLQLTSDANCTTCNGSGARPGTQPKACSQCGGRGVVNDNQGLFAFQSPCRGCGGRGAIIEYPCGNCRGTGTERRLRDMPTRIPAGVSDGQQLRLRGKGSPGRNGGPHGDLLVTCRVEPHSVFARDGHNLTVRVPITFAEAALGGTIDVPTLLDGPVSLRLKAGTATGSRHRVKGKGIVTNKHTGDLIVTVDIDVPTELTDQQRAAIEAFATATTVSPRQRLFTGED
jgi:molecular chaperone DnaJ